MYSKRYTSRVHIDYLYIDSVIQDNASKLLLAIMESRHDNENADKILYNMSPHQLVCTNFICCFYFTYSKPFYFL